MTPIQATSPPGPASATPGSLQFVSLMLHLNGGRGHVLPYHKAVSEAIHLTGWSFVAGSKPDPALQALGPRTRWVPLQTGVIDLERAEVMRLAKSFRCDLFFHGVYEFTRSLVNFLLGEAKNIQGGKQIVFIESFNPLQLLALVIAAFAMRKSGVQHFLIMYRGGPNWGGPKHWMMSRSFAHCFKWLTRRLERIVGAERVIYVTDSDKLRASLPDFYKRTVHLLPIPHTASGQPRSRSVLDQSAEIKAWWPGAPRDEKGRCVIDAIAKRPVPRDVRLRLVLPKSTGLSTNTGGPEIELVDDNLAREVFDARFEITDIVLLPYDRDIYNESTSGIFVETVFSGAIPLVTDSTWMAFELEKHDLQDLIIDWAGDDVARRICDVSRNAEIRNRLNRMSAHYRKFHSVKNFASVLDELLNVKTGVLPHLVSGQRPVSSRGTHRDSDVVS